MLSCMRAPRGERKNKNKKKKKKKRKDTSPNSQIPDGLESSSINPYSLDDNVSNDIILSSSSQTVYGDVNEKLSSFSLQSSDDVRLTSATASFTTDDYNFSSSRNRQSRKKNKKVKAKGSRSKQNKSGDDDEGDDKGDVDFVDDGSDVVSNPMLTGDEVVEWYDKLFISMYPDDRVQDITASHNHLRHWTYYPKPQDGTARTSHEKQWIEEHLKTSHGSQSHPKSLNRNLPPSASTIDSDYPGRPSLHEEYLTQRSSLRISLDSTSSRGSGHSTTDRPPLWQLAGYSSLKEINPVKMSIVQMLMNMDEPTVKGVLMAKNQSA